MRAVVLSYDLLAAALGLVGTALVVDSSLQLNLPPLVPLRAYLPPLLMTHAYSLVAACGLLLVLRRFVRGSGDDSEARPRSRSTALDFTQLDREDPATFELVRTTIQGIGKAPNVEVIELVDEVVAAAVFLRASDIHMEPKPKDFRISYRIDGILQDVVRLPKGLDRQITSRVKVMSHLDISRTDVPQDGRLEEKVRGRAVSARVSVFPTLHGEKTVVRILETGRRVLGLDEFGIQEDVLAEFRRLLHKPQGMMIFTGPTGSGKTSLLYASITEILEGEEARRSITTLEDPIEQPLEDINQCQVDNKRGLTFAVGLRAMLRQDPDIIMVGEIRDAETANIALQAGQTGHLILTTVHANSSAGAFGRLTDMGIEPFLLASSISGIVAQRLVRRLCRVCRRPTKPPPSLLHQIGLPIGYDGTFFEGTGCRDCNGSGFAGRMAIFELLRNNDSISDLVLRKSPAGEIMKAAQAGGMITLMEDGLVKVHEGKTSLVELLRIVE